MSLNELGEIAEAGYSPVMLPLAFVSSLSDSAWLFLQWNGSIKEIVLSFVPAKLCVTTVSLVPGVPKKGIESYTSLLNLNPPPADSFKK